MNKTTILLTLFTLHLGACTLDGGRQSTSLSGGYGGPSGSAGEAASDGEETTGETSLIVSEATGDGATGEGTTGDGTTGDGATETSETGSGGTDPGTAGDGDPDALPNGAECSGHPECMSGKCYANTLPIGELPLGLCSVCAGDADCVTLGLGISCTLNPALSQATCTDGGLGSYCESQAACKDGLFCEPLVPEAEGHLPAVCSTCKSDAECTGGRRCTPSLDLPEYSGHKLCVFPSSLPQDALCPLDNGGPLCASGHCGLVDLGIFAMAICGECSQDGDCAAGKECKAGKWSDGPIGARCK